MNVLFLLVLRKAKALETLKYVALDGTLSRARLC